ncbi:MAG: alkaline phosphatase family protein [Candidatus Tumulicola sp.]
MFSPQRAFSVVLTVAVCSLTACSIAGGSGRSLPAPQRARAANKPAASSGPIQHIVIMIQENRSFDDFFATFPGADGATTGKRHNGKIIPLKEQTLAGLDINHTWHDYVRDYDSGNMDGFDLSYIGQQPAGTYPYQYVNPAQIAPYWTIARQYALADHMFQTQGSGSFTAHQDLIAGGTAIDPYDSLVDTPSSSLFWGCDAPPSTTTSLITTGGQYLLDQGPFPCLTYPTGTLRDLLDAQKVSWKYYTPPHKQSTAGALWNAFAAIAAVRHGLEWATNISIPETNVLSDIATKRLPAVAWVIPDQPDSDHPHRPHGIYHGPEWVASVVNAIGTSSYWKTTAIVIVWDDWGGFYDHEPPPFLDTAGGLGFRVPMLVVSPYVPAGTISHTQYEFGSILKFVEGTFNLGSLGTTDARATSISDIFNFNQQPRAFSPIPAVLNRRYFLHRPPSYEPVDSQ